jgi:nitrite reductase (NO-forming)
MSEMSEMPTTPAGEYRVRRDSWLVAVTIAAMITMMGAVVAAGLAFRASDDAQRASQTRLAAASAPIAPTGSPQHVDVELGEFYIKPATISVSAGTPLLFHVTNKGTVPHNFTVAAKATPDLAPGASADLSVDAVQQSQVAFCSIPGHRQAGMQMQIQVTAAGTSHPVAATEGTPAGGDAKVDPSAKPGPGWKPFDPSLKPADGATTHAITLHATETVLEVAPGVKQQMWTFNGQVPAPILRGHVGDVFTVTLINDAKMGHSIDFHASQTAMDTNMRTIAPGQSLVYQFTADHAGIWMYHCGTAPTLQHIGNGMYGAVVIDPPDLAPVDHEYVLVQSELYFGPQGQPGDFSKMSADKPDAVVFNGYFDQYKFAPIHVAAHQRIRIWILDAGPNDPSSFHIVGTQFDTVFKEGAYLLRPGNAEHGASQALDLSPAQGGFVEFPVPEDGSYSIVSHRFADPGRGALGTLIAGTQTAAAG